MIVELSSIYWKIHRRFIAVGHKYGGRDNGKGDSSIASGRRDRQANNERFFQGCAVPYYGHMLASLLNGWGELR
jgi:hypothetical protein